MENLQTVVTLPRTSGATTIHVGGGPPGNLALPATLSILRSGAVLTALTCTAWVGQTVTVWGAAAGFSDASLKVGDILTPAGFAYLPVAATDTVDAQGRLIGAAGGGSGTVTSVALTVPSILSVSGSPVTTSGTIAASLATQTANTVFAGATSGGAAAPAFRALVAADVPALPYDMIATLANSPVSVTGATSLTSGAFGKFQLCSGTSANYTVTLPAPAGNAGKFIGFRMDPGLTKLVTLAQNASETIDGAASRVMWAGETAILLTDGTNWFKIAGRSLPMQAQVNRNATQAIAGSTHVKILMNVTGSDNTGLMADPTNNQIVCRRKGTYNVSAQAFYQSLAVNEATLSAELYINGADYVDVNYSALSGAYASAPWNGPVALNSGDTVQLWTICLSGTAETLYGAGNFLSLTEVLSW